jgi:hypothetical protein
MENNIPLNDEFFTHIIKTPSLDKDQLLRSVKIDPKEELLPPQVCWKIINENGEESNIGTLGNFSLIIGKAKSRKSFFISLGVSATTKNGFILNRFKGSLYAMQNDVLYFDTEQSKYHVQKAVKRICSMVGNEAPDNLHVYGLRKYTPFERLELIEHAIYSNLNTGFVVIDGIKDLVTSINDEEQATNIASKLLKWTEERNIHIVTVLHQNKGDNNARGHLGTELVNKAETVLSVTKSAENKEISIVEAEYCRDKDPEPFAFEIDSYGMPQIVDGWQVKTAKNTNKVGVDEFAPNQIYSLVLQCFSKFSELGYSELTIQMKLAFKTIHKKPIGDNKAKEIITHCKNENWVLQDTPKGKYKIGEFDSQA